MEFSCQDDGMQELSLAADWEKRFVRGKQKYKGKEGKEGGIQ